MRKLTLAEALHVAEQVDGGIRNAVTLEARYAPLWQHHFVSESFLRMLRAYDEDEQSEFHRLNFENVCRIMAPDFLRILDQIDLPDNTLDLKRYLDMGEHYRHMRVEPDVMPS